MRTDTEIKVALTGADEPSGLAMMMSQYFEQNIRDFPEKTRQALNIRGKLAIEASEGDVGVTLVFRGGEIEVADGCASDAEIFVRGGIFSLTELATGGASAFLRIVRGELKVRSAWKHPVFALRVARFMSLPAEMKSGDAQRARAARLKLAAGAVGAAAVIGTAAYFLMK